MNLSRKGLAKGLVGSVWALLAGVVVAAPEWEDPAVNSINRLPARTYSMPLVDTNAALSDALEPATPWKKLLNGDWKISWTGNPELRVKDFWKVDFDDSKWSIVDVPSCVEMRGFGSPGYTNWRYPYKDCSNPKNADFAKILDRQSGKADYNPVSSYRTQFEVPSDWEGRKIVLRFDGVYSAYYVWVNGEKVGYAEDSKLPSEFDITALVKPGKNLLAVEVYRWCDGSYFEDQDMFRFSGIFRDVSIWAMPKDGIWDFEVKTALSEDFKNAFVSLTGIDGNWSATLYDAGKKSVAALSPAAPSAALANPELWSAETPYLYTLVIRKGDDIRMKRVGFKNQKIVGNTILVNGKMIKFKGVNRHEATAENGRAITLDMMIKDIELMKRYNINTVRTSHYPNDYRWYDLCDKYGIYLVGEANVEGHEPSYGENGLGLFPEWKKTIVERNERHVVYYRNNVAITLWSLGNETGHGPDFRAAIAAVRALDPTRPIHWERGNTDADVDSRMYPEVEWLIKRGEIGNLPRTATETVTEGYDDVAAQSAGKPFFLCEYAHAMGNAVGNFQEYWDTFYAYDSLTGGCIWDWVDQALWKYTGRIDPKTGKPERYLSYGGDYDEQPNDGPFCCNGVILPTREVSAKLVEIGHVFRNLIVRSAADGKLELENRYGFLAANAFDAEWELLANGKIVEKGTLEVPALAPLSRCEIAAPKFKTKFAKEGTEYLFNIKFKTRTATDLVPQGWVVAANQLKVAGNWAFDAVKGAADAKKGVKITQDEKSVTVKVGDTKAVFCRKTGTLAALEMKGKTILKDLAPGLAAGPELTCMRALTDNDNWMRNDVFNSGLTQLRHHPEPIVVDGNTVKTVVKVTGSKSAGFTHETTWAFAADGSITLDVKVTPFGTIWHLPRLGLSLALDKSLDTVVYYGRGPRENYIDRRTGSLLGIWASSVEDLWEEYTRPQDNGSRTDVRWVSFADTEGKGVKFAASEPLFVQAMPYDWEDLEFSRHRNGQLRYRAPLVPREQIHVNLDVRQMGLGGASCGPAPMEKYRFNPNAPVSWSLRLSPL